MSTPSLTNVTLRSLQNTSADTLAGLLLLPHALMPMMAKMLLFITTGMTMINSSSRPFRLWNSLLAWSNTFRKNISSKSDTMDFMQGIANLTKRYVWQSQRKKEEFFFPLIVGEILPLPLLAMIRLHVLVAARSCFFLNSTIIISIFLWTKCTKEQWGNFPFIPQPDFYTKHLRLW